MNDDRKQKVVSQVETERQKDYMQKVRAVNQKVVDNTGRKPLFCQTVFGCQMNARDSEKLAGMLVEMLYEETNDEKLADLIIYNTCCVRENAENKVYGNLGYLKHVKQEEKKDLKIILCGCMMQQGAVIDKIKKSYRHVDVIFGTFNIYRLPELLYTNIETERQVIDIWDNHKDIVEDLPAIRNDKFKAGVNIMYGCNNFCSYCIVPYVRGRERSREVEDILSEIRSLSDKGIKEITLLGQNVNSYDKIQFSKLLYLISDIEGIERIRFMTSHPKDLSDDLINAIAELPKVCGHVHLPVQSGSTDILRKMNRRYTKDDYLALAEKIKTTVPNVSLSTDIIVGFPGETDEDFLETLDVIKKVKFSAAFTFIYSKRTGTPAAVMEDTIDEETLKKRFNTLVEEVNSIIYHMNKELVGKCVKVLAEDFDPEKGLVTGRTESNTIVHFKGDMWVLGKIIDVKIVDCKTFYLIGEC